MKKTIMMAIAFALTGAAVQAQTASKADDYQSGTFFRSTSGMIETIPAVTTDYKIYDQVTLKPKVDPLTGQQEVERDTPLFYEKRTPLNAVEVMGANYAYLKGGFLVTVGSTGTLIYKGKLSYEADVFGGNFLFKKGTREIVSIRADGWMFDGTKLYAPATRLIGGNFFIDASNELWTVDAKGFIYHYTDKKYPLAQLAGGNYFYQQDGTIVTIASNGLPLEAFKPNSKPINLGGNYYIGEDRVLYSVRHDGISFANGVAGNKIKNLGYSYVIYADDSFHVVDGEGRVHSSVMRISHTGARAVKTNKVAGPLEVNSVYTPNSRK